MLPGCSPCKAWSVQVSEELKKALGGWAEKRRWDELGITKQVKNQDFNWACS